jgi:casein kinase 1
MHYRVGKKIGEGSFGTIHVGVCTLTDRPVAIKFEPRIAMNATSSTMTASNKHDPGFVANQLSEEWRSYKMLEGTSGIPRAYYYGCEGNFWCLVMDLKGPSLEAIFEKTRHRFSISCVAYLAIKMVLVRIISLIIDRVDRRGAQRGSYLPRCQAGQFPPRS